MKIIDSIFVYGTLRKGERLNPALDNANYLGDATIEGSIVNLGAFPGLIPKVEEEARVYGEVYEIDDAILRDLDRIEGTPFLYTREEVDTDEFGTVYTYMYNRDYSTNEVIESGNWLER